MTQEELKMELEELAVRFSEGWHEGIKIDASDIMLLNEAAQALAQPEDPCKGANYSQASEQEPVAWRTFDGEGGYDYRDYDMNENYDKEWAERNPNHAHWVEPLFVKENT